MTIRSLLLQYDFSRLNWILITSSIISASVSDAAGPQVITKNYLMAFQTCDLNAVWTYSSSCSSSSSTSSSSTKTSTSSTSSTSTSVCNTPNEYAVYLAESNDFTTWTTAASWNICTNNGSVPDLVRRQDTVYIYSVYGSSLQVLTYDAVTGTTSGPNTVTITDSATGLAVSAVDPNPIVYDDAGTLKIGLTFLLNDGSSDPARCDSAPCTKYIQSATETGTLNGQSFTLDSGNRTSVSLTTTSESASDPDVFWYPSGYIMLVGRGPGIQAFSSTTRSGTYTAISGLTDGYIIQFQTGDSYSHNVGSGFYDVATGYYHLFTTALNMSGTGEASHIRHASVSSLSSTLLDSQFSSVVSGALSGINSSTSGASFLTSSPGITHNRRRSTR